MIVRSEIPIEAALLDLRVPGVIWIWLRRSAEVVPNHENAVVEEYIFRGAQGEPGEGAHATLREGIHAWLRDRQYAVRYIEIAASDAHPYRSGAFEVAGSVHLTVLP